MPMTARVPLAFRGSPFLHVSLPSRHTLSGLRQRNWRNVFPVSRQRLCVPPQATLDPPNDEVDWIFVDVSTKNPPDALTSRLEDEIQDDAKSLVRVALRDAPVELSVVLCSDDDIRAMNSRWRGLDNATDVLSFPQDDPDQVVLGDIVISVETAARQAEERGDDLRDEVRVLLVHGLLHLMGYDHEGKTEGDWLVMAQMENRFMNQLSWRGEGLVSAAQDSIYRDIVQP